MIKIQRESMDERKLIFKSLSRTERRGLAIITDDSKNDPREQKTVKKMETNAIPF